MTNFQEDLLKGRHGDTIALNIHVSQIFIKVCEEVLEHKGVFTGNLYGHLALDLSQFHHLWPQPFMEVWHNLSVIHGVSFDDRHDIADTEAILQEHGRSQARHFTRGHDANPIAENVSFVHVMGSQEDDSILLLFTKHVP